MYGIWWKGTQKGNMRFHNQYDADTYFASRGATHVHEDHYPTKRVWTCDYVKGNHYKDFSRVFSRHYLNAEGTEIGYVIPDLYEFGTGVEFNPPRVWSIAKNLQPLTLAKGELY